MLSLGELGVRLHSLEAEQLSNYVGRQREKRGRGEGRERNRETDRERQAHREECGGRKVMILPALPLLFPSGFSKYANHS